MPRKADPLQHTGDAAHILITGLPGVGKTTMIRGLAKRLAKYNPQGFYTEELRNCRRRREGFQVVTLCDRRLVLSHIDFTGRSRVGHYGVDIAGFEQFLTDLDLSHAESRLFMIDEIGKMECLSRRFVNDMTTLLNGPNIVVATIALKGEGFIRQVKRRPDCRLVTVTKENRDRLGHCSHCSAVRKVHDGQMALKNLGSFNRERIQAFQSRIVLPKEYAAKSADTWNTRMRSSSCMISQEVHPMNKVAPLGQ